jgi:uncharacterized protein YhaN
VKITDIQVDGFGVWKGLTVDNVSSNVTVFYGQNEAGKTTLMQFIRSMLFGFSPDRLEKYVPPVYGGLAGGSAFVKSSQGTFEIQRHVDPNRHADAQGDLTLVDNKKGDVHGNATLSSLLANIDESIFNNVFAVGLREIQELGSLNNTQAADHLYRLTSGLDRVSLVDVMRDLQKRRDGLWTNDPKAESAIVKLQTRRQHLLKEIEEQRQKSKRWSRIAAQAKEATKRLEDLQEELKQVEREARLVELSIQLSDRWQSRELISQQIEAFGNLPDPREVSVSTLDQLNQKIIKQKERANQIRAERKNVIAERDKLGIHSGIWDLRTKVEALQAHTPWIESLERQAQQYREEIERIESSVDGEIEGLGSQVKLKNRDLNDLANRGISSLKSVAVNLTEQQKKLTRLKDEADKAKFELGQNEKQLGDSLSETTGSIPESLEDTSRNVNRLRRRLELDEKIDKLQKSRSELEMEIDNVVEDQVLPVGKLAVIGLVFVTGFILFGFGVLSSGALPNWNATFSQIGGLSQDVGIVMIIMGLVCGFIALGVKYHWERVARDSMDDFRHQIEMVRNQLKRARAERDEIDRLLPPGTNQVELDLQDAESRLTRLEGLVPLENRAKTSRMRLEEIRRMITAQEREVEECEKRWQSSLRAMGLPDSLTPQQVREISVRSGRIADYSSRLELCRSELATREKELAQVSLRVGEMLATAGIKSEATLKSPLLALQKLNNLINEQRQLITTKKELRVTYTTLRSNLEKARRECDRLLGQRLKLLSSVGVETEEEYRQFDVKHAERSKLVEKRKQLTEQIAAALGKGMTEDDVRPLLSSYGKSGLEKRWEQLESDIDRLKSEQASLLQQRGERLQEIKALGEDSRLDMARLELNTVDAELEKRLHDWQRLTTSSYMLDSIREGYESKRQPETLKEASHYLEQLTDGHYKRIWTRLVGEELLVDNNEGETITVDKLSRGTREAVYLSLRLALVTVYARRGAVIPLVFDDILVNFDAKRMRTAAKLLMDFSKQGYQLLMFTCHDHVRDVFHALEADVRVLPHHRDVVENGAIPIRYQVTIPVKPAAPVPVPVALPAIETRSRIELVPEQYDSELEYELSAVLSDQKEQFRLRHEAVYDERSTGHDLELALAPDYWSNRSTRHTA